MQDYPKAGTAGGDLWIGTNQYDNSDITNPPMFLTAGVWAIPTARPGDSSCPTNLTGRPFFDAAHPMLNEDNTYAFTPVPAVIKQGARSTSHEFIVAARNPGNVTANKLMVWRGGWNFNDPFILRDGDVTVNAYSVPADAPQPGTTFLLNTMDARLTQAVARVDPDQADPDAPGFEEFAIWTQHTIDGPSGGRSVVRWYELVQKASHLGQYTVQQQGEVQNATDFVFNGAISPSNRGNDGVVIYNRSSATTAAVVAAQSRTSGTPPGTMDPGEVILAQSVDGSGLLQFSDLDFTCNSGACPWGDYSGASPDPILPGVVWGSNQINGPPDPNGNPPWRTNNFAVGVAVVPQ